MGLPATAFCGPVDGMSPIAHAGWEIAADSAAILLQVPEIQ